MVLPFSPNILAASGTAVRLEFIESVWSNTTPNPKTFAAVGIGDAATDRLVVMTVTWARSGATSLSSATIGGVTATIGVQQNSGSNHSCAIIYAVVPTGTTADVVLTWAQQPARSGVGSYRVTKLLSTTPTDSDSIGAGSDGTLTLNIATEAKGCTICVASGTSDHAWTNATEDYDDSNGSDYYTGASFLASSGVMTAVEVTNARCAAGLSFR